MVRKLTESFNQTEIRDEKTFSVLDDRVFVLEAGEDGFSTRKSLNAKGEFVNITQLLFKLCAYDAEIPIRMDSFDDVEFNRISSRLRLDYTTAEGVHKALVMVLYENPCWMEKKNLHQYGIDF